MIRTAVVPVAGLGTRLRPWTHAAAKALLPLVDPQNAIRPVVHVIAAEAASAGAQRLVLVASPGQIEPLEAYFSAVRDTDAGAELPETIRCRLQREPRGFGDAVLQAEEDAAGEPVLVMLGDHVHRAAGGAERCGAQVAGAWDRHGGAAMIGVQPVDAAELSRVGTVAGEPLGKGVYRCTDFVEKPDAATAAERLRTPGLPEGEYLAHCGLYVFDAAIFDCLRAVAESGPAGEVELADAQRMLLDRRAGEYRLCRIDGRAYDTGTPGNYAAAFAAMRAHAG
jgi:UTP--glucose-1-phosphate uridylyltransferase